MARVRVSVMVKFRPVVRIMVWVRFTVYVRFILGLDLG
jgi:hypothetical protein